MDLGALGIGRVLGVDVQGPSVAQHNLVPGADEDTIGRSMKVGKN